MRVKVPTTDQVPDAQYNTIKFRHGKGSKIENNAMVIKYNSLKVWERQGLTPMLGSK
jgi:hypothetical protein